MKEEHVQLGKLPKELVDQFDEIRGDEPRIAVLRQLMEDYVSRKSGKVNGRRIKDEVMISVENWMINQVQFETYVDISITLTNKSKKEIYLDRILYELNIQIDNWSLWLGEAVYLRKEKILPNTPHTVKLAYRFSDRMFTKINQKMNDANAIIFYLRGDLYGVGDFPPFNTRFDGSIRIAQSDWNIDWIERLKKLRVFDEDIQESM